MLFNFKQRTTLYQNDKQYKLQDANIVDIRVQCCMRISLMSYTMNCKYPSTSCSCFDVNFAEITCFPVNCGANLNDTSIVFFAPTLLYNTPTNKRKLKILFLPKTQIFLNSTWRIDVSYVITVSLILFISYVYTYGTRLLCILQQ